MSVWDASAPQQRNGTSASSPSSGSRRNGQKLAAISQPVPKDVINNVTFTQVLWKSAFFYILVFFSAKPFWQICRFVDWECKRAQACKQIQCNDCDITVFCANIWLLVAVTLKQKGNEKELHLVLDSMWCLKSQWVSLCPLVHKCNRIHVRWLREIWN